MIDLINTLQRMEHRLLKYGLPIIGVLICAFHLAHSVYQDKQTAEEIKTSLAILLEDPLVNSEAIETFKIAQSLERSIQGLSICIKDDKGNFIYGEGCKNDFTNLPFNFYPSSFKVSVDLNTWKQHSPLILFISLIISILLLIRRRLSFIIRIIAQDLSTVSDGKKAKIKSKEFHELYKKIQERAELRSKLETAKKESEHAEELRNIAHDIKSPLHVLQFVMEKAELKSSLDMLANQALKQVNGVCENILFKSKQKNRSSTNLTSFLKVFETNKLCEYNSCEYKGLSLEFQIKVGKTSTASFDAVQIQSILSNLVNNAIQATISKTKRKVHFTAIERNKMLEIVVSDNGCGIQDKNRHKIFQRNFTTKETGNGIALHNAKEYVTNLGGQLKFESSSQGTVFFLSIPLEDIPPKASPSPQSQNSHHSFGPIVPPSLWSHEKESEHAFSGK